MGCLFLTLTLFLSLSVLLCSPLSELVELLHLTSAEPRTFFTPPNSRRTHTSTLCFCLLQHYLKCTHLGQIGFGKYFSQPEWVGKCDISWTCLQYQICCLPAEDTHWRNASTWCHCLKYLQADKHTHLCCVQSHHYSHTHTHTCSGMHDCNTTCGRKYQLQKAYSDVSRCGNLSTRTERNKHKDRQRHKKTNKKWRKEMRLSGG